MYKKVENYTSAVKKSFLIFFCCSLFSSAAAQTVSLDLGAYEEAIRRQQLLGNNDSLISFNIRPLYINGRKGRQLTMGDSIPYGKNLLENKKFHTKLDILPLRIYNEFNSHHPYGWNNGSLLRSKGLQTQLSGGVFTKVGPLHVQLRPEINFIQNGIFDGYIRADEPISNLSTILPNYYGYHYSRIDLPEGFGSESISQVLPGQSSVKFIYKGYALGVSTENIWWGPSKRNALLMSNNAPGFAHATFHTTYPAKTPIGAFEGQVIVGRLESSGFLPLQEGLAGPKPLFFNFKSENWRYFTGFNLSYNPRWSPGLFIGMSRTIQQYYTDTKLHDDYFPIIMNFFRKNDEILDDHFNRDQYISLYLRWLWKKARAEWYFEYGRNDASYHFRDFIMTPEHSRAYTFGFVKLVPLSKKGEFVQVHTEVTQLQQTVNYLIRDAVNWYTHFQVRHGYTHRGEVLGAGIGPGSNVQFLEVSWINGLNKLGLQFERLVNNNDFYYRNFQNTEVKQPWVDLSGGLNSTWKLDNFVLNGKIQYIRSLNYWWQDEPQHVPYFYKGHDVGNLFLTFGAIYGFK